MYQGEYFETRGGRLFYRHFQGTGSPALLGLHGFGDTGATFHFLEGMLEKYFELFFMDWRGHGNSSPLSEGYYNASLLLGDLAMFTGGVLPNSYVLMGHSMGAAAAARFAGLFPEEVRGLILFEGFSGVVSARTEIDRLRAWARGLRKNKTPRERTMKSIEMARQTLRMMHPRMSDAGITFFAKEWTHPAPGEDGLVWHMDPRMRDSFSPLPFPWYLSRNLWKNIRCPVLLFYGKETALRPENEPGRVLGDAGAEPSETGDPLAEITAHFADLEFHDLENCGHNMHHDRPDEVTRIMEEWLLRKRLV